MSRFHQITFSQTVGYINNYLKYSKLLEVANTINFGGMFPVAKHDRYQGFVFWFCWNNDNQIPGLPPFFLALENNTYDTSNAIPIEIKSDKLSRPSNDSLFIYPYDTAPNYEQLSTFLKNHNHLPNNSRPVDISKYDVEYLNYYFFYSFPDGNFSYDYRTCPCCFFAQENLETGEQDTSVADFLKQDMAYIRYYCSLVPWGDIYIIKIILFGVDADGKNLLGDDNIILEQSWPPDPFQ